MSQPPKAMLKEHRLTCALLDGCISLGHVLAVGSPGFRVYVTWFDATAPGSSLGQLLHLLSRQQDRVVPAYCSPSQQAAVASFLLTASPIGLKGSHIIVLACVSD